jgi:UDP-4-amino-4,6-dideoxy-N-acetyl-beta-L-altrosamine transaminase
MSLAVDGGEPIRKTMLPYGRHWIDEKDILAVVNALRSDWLTTGPKISELEEAFAERVGAEYAVALSSGTAALHAAAFAAGIGPGDDAITTPLTFVATSNCVLYQRARPVFADIREDTLTIDPQEIESKLTPHTRALIPADYAGQASDMDEINSIAEEHGLVVIEDAAHALGGTYKGRRVGTLANMTVFSTHPLKLITTGEGGIITTDDLALARRLRQFRNHGITTEARERKNEWFYEMVALGYNYRITDLQCALGLSQLAKAEDFLKKRRAIAKKFNQAFEGLSGVEIPVERADRSSAWHLYVVRLSLDKLRVGRSQVFKALRAENIGVNVHYIPVPWHPYYQELGFKKGECPNAERVYEQLLSLPIFPAMTDSDVEDVIQALNKVVSAYRR